MRDDWDALFAQPRSSQQQPVLADGVPCEWIDAPEARADRVVLYCHGGGFRLGSIVSHRELAARDVFGAPTAAEADQNLKHCTERLADYTERVFAALHQT